MFLIVGGTQMVIKILKSIVMSINQFPYSLLTRVGVALEGLS